MAAQATKALANANINIEMINQGASEISMMFAVKKMIEKCIKCVRKSFF